MHVLERSYKIEKTLKPKIEKSMTNLMRKNKLELINNYYHFVYVLGKIKMKMK